MGAKRDAAEGGVVGDVGEVVEAQSASLYESVVRAVHRFEDCPTPFRCVACTDDGRPGRIVFHEGPLLPAIFASMTIPGIVTPLPALQPLRDPLVLAKKKKKKDEGETEKKEQ